MRGVYKISFERWPLLSVECECRRRVPLGRSGPASAIGQNRVLHRSGTRSGQLVVSVCLDDCNMNVKLPRLTLFGPHVTLSHVPLRKADSSSSVNRLPSSTFVFTQRPAQLR